MLSSIVSILIIVNLDIHIYFCVFGGGDCLPVDVFVYLILMLHYLFSDIYFAIP